MEVRIPNTLVVDLSIAVEICFADHVIDLFVGQPLAELLHCRLQLLGVDHAAPVRIKNCMGYVNYVLYILQISMSHACLDGTNY